MLSYTVSVGESALPTRKKDRNVNQTHWKKTFVRAPSPEAYRTLPTLTGVDGLRSINSQPPAGQETAGVGWVVPSPMRRLDLP